MNDASAQTPAARRVSWLSLLRTVRAPLAVLLSAGAALLFPPQMKDMLDALSDGSLGGLAVTLSFHAALALVSISAWYWSRALLAARFNVGDTREARAQLVARDARLNARALDVVPRGIFTLAVLLGIGVIARSGGWYDLPYLGAWAIPLGLFVVYRMDVKDKVRRYLGFPLAAEAGETARLVLPKTPSFRQWLRDLWPRFLLLLRRAPFSDRLSYWPALIMFIVAAAGFVFGAFESFVEWGARHESLPALVASVFPGPAAVLLALSLMIAPFSVLTFLFDGLELRFRIKGIPMGFHRPPVIVPLLLWILVMPTVFSLHTVRIVAKPKIGRQIGDRADLAEFFRDWVTDCTRNGESVRPVIVAISGGASRAAVWGARVLQEVERSSGEGRPAIFAVSSVSGGSLGAAAYFSLLADMPPEERCSGGATQTRQAKLDFLATPRLAQDALGPLLAGALFVDIPRAIFSPFAAGIRSLTGAQPRGGDRAEAIERAFERLWRQPSPSQSNPSPASRADFGDPFLSLFYDANGIRRGMPVWIANGTDMATGARLLTVPFRPDGAWPFRGAADALSALGADVPISTAINNTARFPYLEPAGELLRDSVAQARVPQPPDNTSEQIIDGGYFENEGLQTALDLAEWIEAQRATLTPRVVQPIIVQATADGSASVILDTIVRCGSRLDDPTFVSPTQRPLQLVAPLLGLYSVRGAHSAVLLRQARDIYCRTTPKSFFHFFLPGQDGKDVPLNWILSDSTHRFIWNAMDAEGSGNTAEHESLATAFQSP